MSGECGPSSERRRGCAYWACERRGLRDKHDEGVVVFFGCRVEVVVRVKVEVSVGVRVGLRVEVLW